jgi:adenylate kinase
MNLVLLGPPGAGKGTQAKAVAAKRGLVQLSTGDILRRAVEAGTDIGRQAKTLMDKGQLVPDGIVLTVVADRIAQADCRTGFILDGFPRTLQQAAALDEILDNAKTKLHAVIELSVDPDSLAERIVGRHACATCGEGYHDRFKQPKHAGVCDKCGSTAFSRRPDDTENTLLTRLMAYYRNTAPLAGYYFCKGSLRTVDGMLPIGQVASQIDHLLDAEPRDCTIVSACGGERGQAQRS